MPEVRKIRANNENERKAKTPKSKVQIDQICEVISKNNLLPAIAFPFRGYESYYNPRQPGAFLVPELSHERILVLSPKTHKGFETTPGG